MRIPVRIVKHRQVQTTRLHPHELQRCIERPNRYLAIVNWVNLDDQTVRFRESGEYQEWRGWPQAQGDGKRVSMNKINPKKLLNSKWTAVIPVKKEKHFLITELEFDEEGDVVRCIIEAVRSKRCALIEWTELKNGDNWFQGWN